MPHARSVVLPVGNTGQIFFLFFLLLLLAGLPATSFGDEPHQINAQRTARVNTLFAVGDIMLSGSATPLLQKKGYDHPFKDKDLAELTTSADVAFGNLEHPITRAGVRCKDKKYAFRGSFESLNAIKNAGFDLLSLANNHIMDYGEKGLMDTIRQCRKQNLVFAGAGADLAAASRFGILEKDGVKYGLLAYSLTFPKEFWATPEKPGTAHPDWAQLEWDVRNAKQALDILIVSFHWGEELQSEPKQYQIDYAHHAINSGADVVLGHHPHIPQPIEIFMGKPIFYSLGNYAFGTFSDNVAFSFAAEIRFDGKDPVQVNVYPLNVHNQDVSFQPRLAQGSSAEMIIVHLRDISKIFGTRIECENGIGTIVITSK